MTVMDKICGRGEYQQWIGSLCAACMWIHTKAVLCVEHDSIHIGVHEKRMMLSIMKSDNWVCEDALEELEWVCPLTISLKEEDEVLTDLEFEIRHSLFGTMGFLWFPAPSRLNVRLDCHGAKIVKYQTWQLRRLSMPLAGGHVTSRTRLLESVALISGSSIW